MFKIRQVQLLAPGIKRFVIEASRIARRQKPGQFVIVPIGEKGERSSALRFGAHKAYVYRRSEVEMPARIEEVHHAQQEGIEFHMLMNPVEFLSDEKGWLRAARCVRMELGETDVSGRRHCHGSATVILAMGAGRRAAKSIHEYVTSGVWEAPAGLENAALPRLKNHYGPVLARELPLRPV